MSDDPLHLSYPARRALGGCVSLLLLAGCFGPSTRPGEEEPDRSRGSGPVAAITRGADGLEIAYTLFGEGERMLVLLHGWGGSQELWTSQVDDLLQRYSVVTLDFGGHGRSGRGRSGGSLAQLTTDVVAVLDAVDAKGAVLVGHSLGGKVALLAAKERPERVAGLIGVEAFDDPPPSPAVWNEVLAQLDENFPAGCRSFVNGLFAVTTEETMVAKTAAQTCTLDPKLGKALLRELAAFDLGKNLAGLPAALPVRSIAATEEFELPATPGPEPLQRFHANTRTLQIAKSGHYPMLEQGAELTRQLAAALKEIEK